MDHELILNRYHNINNIVQYSARLGHGRKVWKILSMVFQSTDRKCILPIGCTTTR